MADVEGIVEELEKAEGPSFKLDDAIYEYMLPLFEEMPWGQFTSDINAALNLIPASWRTTHAYGGAGNDWIWNLSKKRTPNVDDNGMYAAGKHRHPAIAICIAALKAHASLRAQHKGDRDG